METDTETEAVKNSLGGLEDLLSDGEIEVGNQAPAAEALEFNKEVVPEVSSDTNVDIATSDSDDEIESDSF